MNRLDILNEIDSILEIYDESSNRQELDTRLKQLKELLLGNTTHKIEKLLRKGRDLTASEIQWLLDKGVSKKRIYKKMHMNCMGFYEYLDNHGIRHEKKEVNVVAQGDINQAKELLKTTNLSLQEISNRTGAKVETIRYHSKKYRVKGMEILNQNEETNQDSSFEKLKEEKEQVEQSVKELQEMVNNLTEERDSFKDEYSTAQTRQNDMRDTIRRLSSENAALASQLDIKTKQHDALLKYVFYSANAD